jgi:dihydrofolate reductase
MRLSIIVAVSENGVIGNEGDMPWKKLPSDLKYFKEKTTGHWCLLGRKTYEALGNKVLPGRQFIIITRDQQFISADSLVVHSLSDAINHPLIQHEEEVFVLGGGEVYRQILPYCHYIYLTRIHANFDGDTHFEEPDLSNWFILSSDEREADEKNPYDHTFLIYERKPEFFE